LAAAGQVASSGKRLIKASLSRPVARARACASAVTIARELWLPPSFLCLSSSLLVWYRATLRGRQDARCPHRSPVQSAHAASLSTPPPGSAFHLSVQHSTSAPHRACTARRRRSRPCNTARGGPPQPTHEQPTPRHPTHPAKSPPHVLLTRASSYSSSAFQLCSTISLTLRSYSRRFSW